VESFPRLALHRIEEIIVSRLGNWPPRWEGFHWPGYTLEHTTRVRHLALALGEREGADRAVVEPAAILHDLAKPQGKEHARLGAEEADHILHDLQVAAGLRKRIVDAIALHSGDNTPDHPIENRVLGDADLIDANFGAVATWRFITIRAGHDMPLAETIAGMVEWLPRKNELQALLLTDAGREVARERSAAMHALCTDIAAAHESDAGAHAGLRAIVDHIAADYARANLQEQLGYLEAIVAGDEEGRRVWERLRAEAAGEC
jgi:uncharacterized protein